MASKLVKFGGGGAASIADGALSTSASRYNAQSMLKVAAGRKIFQTHLDDLGGASERLIIEEMEDVVSADIHSAPSVACHDTNKRAQFSTDRTNPTIWRLRAPHVFYMMAFRIEVCSCRLVYCRRRKAVVGGPAEQKAEGCGYVNKVNSDKTPTQSFLNIRSRLVFLSIFILFYFSFGGLVWSKVLLPEHNGPMERQ